MTLLQAVLYLLLLGCFLLTALSFAVRDAVLDRTLYRDVVRRPSVPSRMIEYAREELEAECLFYGLPFDIIDEALNESVAAVYAESYVDAVYDAMFEQAWRECLQLFETLQAEVPDDGREALRFVARAFFDFAVSNLPRHQLMNLRTIPGFTPSPPAYASPGAPLPNWSTLGRNTDCASTRRPPW